MANNQRMIDDLKRTIVELKNDVAYQKELTIKAEGKIELLEKQSNGAKDTMMLEERQFQREVEWLREVVMLMSIPKEKIEELEKLRERKNLGRGFRNY